MATMNIAGNTPVDDPSYRYKMPKILAKVEGRGNGIKTLLVNVNDVGLSLNREPAEVTKFFGCELGAQTIFSAETDRAIVNGAHTAQDLQRHLSRYIENFVLCANCRLPETHYKIKSGLIAQQCLACGHKEGVDMTHKLTTFILAQHKKAKDLAAKAEKDKEKDKKKKGGAAEDDGDKKKDGKEAAKDGSSSSKKDGDDGNDEKEKKKSSKSKKSSDDLEKDGGAAAAEEEEDVDDAKAADEGMDRLKLWLAEHPERTTAQLLEELRAIQTFASLRPADRIIIYLGTVCTDGLVTKGEVAANKEILCALAPSAIQQRHLIAAFEWFCGRKFPQLMKFFPVVLKQLFDEEIVEEDVFFEWATDLTRNEYSAHLTMIDIDTLEALKTSAALFIKWLQEAEEEGEEEEEDDD